MVPVWLSMVAAMVRLVVGIMVWFVVGIVVWLGVIAMAVGRLVLYGGVALAAAAVDGLGVVACA